MAATKGSRQSARCQLLLKRLGTVQDPTEEFGQLLGPQVAGEDGRLASKFTLQYFDSKSLPPSLMDWCQDLVKSHLYDLYMTVWGWSDEEKRKQLAAPQSKFIVAFAPEEAAPAPAGPSSTVEPADQVAGTSGQPQQAAQAAAGPGRPAAFVNFRFEPGYFGDPVLYVYEVMVEPRYQRMGLGTRLLGLLEEVAWQYGMDQVILTEFTANKAAASLYRKLGFARDKASPSNKGYEILSKSKPGSSGQGQGGKAKSKSGKK